MSHTTHHSFDLLVVLVLENRSFDNLFGYLYENEQPRLFIPDEDTVIKTLLQAAFGNSGPNRAAQHTRSRAESPPVQARSSRTSNDGTWFGTSCTDNDRACGYLPRR